MKVNYSCVVDNHEKFKKQGWIWLNSLIKFGGINPSDIWVHCITGMDAGYIKRCCDTGANVKIIEPFGDKKYCNKIAQMTNAEDADLKNGDIIILMDTDMIMLENFEYTLTGIDSDSIGGKIVDLANPPIEVIDAVFGIAGLKKALPDNKVECGDSKTYGANFNGGLYIIPKKYYDIISEGWQRWAHWLLIKGKPLYDAGKEAHIDQVSFCMTVHENNINVKHLDRAYNYPLPYDFGGDEKMPYILHYHDRVDGNFLLSLDYKPAGNIKQAVDKANEFILKNNLN